MYKVSNNLLNRNFVLYSLCVLDPMYIWIKWASNVWFFCRNLIFRESYDFFKSYTYSYRHEYKDNSPPPATHSKKYFFCMSWHDLRGIYLYMCACVYLFMYIYMLYIHCVAVARNEYIELVRARGYLKWTCICVLYVI